jgi:hypothetical protein
VCRFVSCSLRRTLQKLEAAREQYKDVLGKLDVELKEWVSASFRFFTIGVVVV